MTLLKWKVPPKAAGAAMALALIASIVSGHDQPEASTAPRNVERTAPAAESLANLDIARLKRSNKQEAVSDLLAPGGGAVATPAVVASAQPAAAPATPQAPAAPPLPFSYLGRMVEDGKTKVFVARGADHFSLEPGLAIDKNYKVERVAADRVTFVFLPLGTRQVLPLPALD